MTTYNPSKKAKAVWDKTQGHCWYCGDILDENKWEIEHQTPRSQDGSHGIENLVPTCRFCNKSKRNRSVEEFRAYKKEQVIRLLESSQELLNRLEPLTGSCATDTIKSGIQGAAGLVNDLQILFYGEQRHPR